MLRLALAALLLLLSGPVRADPAVEGAFDAAIAAFERALPRLPASLMGVDVAAYRDALTLRRFASAHWGGVVTLEVELRAEAGGSCRRYAAFVRIPPENGRARLVICPEFLTPGTEALRALTILHELVHVVAGPDECRAMAFAARVELLATGRFTPVDGYWRANGCDSSAFRLP
jgi:hypothetical protein